MFPSSLLGWLSYIESQHPSNIELGLERCSKVLDKLSYIRPKQQVLTIAGTNGKGSTCALLTHYLMDSGSTIGTLTSPHFIDFNERICINNNPVSDEVICEAFAHIERVRGETTLTYFEFNVLAAIWIFSQAKLDYWVLEVGLGGRLDSVNMIDSDLAVVTSISLDHTDWLGDSLEGIAAEKAAIARRGKILVSGVKSPPASLEETVVDIGGVIKQKDRDFGFTVNTDKNCWSWWCDDILFDNLPLPHLPVENAATAIAVLRYINITLNADSLARLMIETSLTGRFQTICDEPHIIVDIAHNSEASIELSKRVARLNKPAIALCGMLHDKDIKSVIFNLENTFTDWHLVDLNVPRGAKASEIAPYLSESKLYVGVEEGLEAAIIQARKEDKIVVVFGSFVTVSECMMYFKGKQISYA